MLAGFSAMQFNLGLLPMQTTQAMAGAPMQMPAPPPPVMHPAQAAANAMAQQQALIQQTMQAAQMTRYQPPPSAPTPAVSAMVGFGGMNPFAAPAVGGSVGFAPGGNVPGRPLGGPSLSPQIGSIFNPFAPTLPPAHFASPAQRNLQIMSTAHSQMLGTIAGIGEAGMGIGGALAGGMLGSALGSLGTAAGGFLGAKIGGGLASMMFNPTVQDMARGRQIQAMTSPFMVSGAFLNTATGQGMNAFAARQTATGLRHLQRDYDFERTGFNTQDTMQIMQMSGDQGLLKGVGSPDALVQKVKDISKTVKVLMRITGDPDVRSAIQALGEMKDLGFQGIAAQAGAVANRSMFARMAGVSQAQAGAYGMMGAGMAEQIGLGGSTGYMAGMSGAALANMAASSGALNDLQLARAGGKGGLAQINARGQLAAMQDERYLLAAMGRDAKGRMTVDMDAYRRAQSMSFQEVSERSAEALRAMGKEGIFEWNTRKQEFKDQVAQKLTPFEMNMNMIRQAQAFKNQVPGMTMGTALQMTTGMGADQARALELQTSSRGWYEAQKRHAQDQLSAQREQFRTPGLGTRLGRGVRGFFGDVSDSLSSPFTSLAERFQRVAESDEAAGRGQRIMRVNDMNIAHDDAERALMRRGLRSGEFQRAYGSGVGSNFLDDADPLSRSMGRQLNRMGSFLGLSSMSNENRLVSIASRSHGSAFGWHPLASFGDAGDAMARVQGLIGAGRAADDAGNFGARDISGLYSRLGAAGTASAGGRRAGFSGGAVMREASRNLVSKLKGLKAGYVSSASAVSANDLKSAYIEAAKKAGMSEGEANASYEQNKTQINASMASDVYATGEKDIIEPFARAQEAATAAGAVDLSRTRDGVKASIENDMRMLGLDQRQAVGGLGAVGYRASEATLRKLKSVVAHNDNDVLALASAQSAMMSGDAQGRESGAKLLTDLEKKLGPEKFAEKMAAAKQLLKSTDVDTQQALRQMSKGTTSGDALMGLTGKMKDMFGKGMALEAQNAFLQRLDDKQKGLGGSKSIEEAVSNVSHETIDRIAKTDPKLAKALLAAKKGDMSGVNAQVEAGAPTTTESRYGGGEGASIDAIDKQVSEIREMRDKLGKDEGSGKEQLQAASAQLFSSSVERFGKYVNDIVGEGEKTQLDRSAPWVQSMFGVRP